MLDLTRRRFIAGLVLTLAGLGIRRAAAVPVRPRIEPFLPMPPPAAPVAEPSKVCMEGWWVGPGGWAYLPELGWMHSFRPMRNLTPAEWYGPPPPIPPLTPCDWGKILNG